MAVAVVKWNDKALRSLVSAKEVRFLRRASAWLQRFAVRSMHGGALRLVAGEKEKNSEAKRGAGAIASIAAGGKGSRFGRRLLTDHAYANEFNEIVKRARRGGGSRKDIRARAREAVISLAKQTSRSRPGQPPHVQTGTLRNSITTDEELRVVQGLVNYAVARVGTNLPYGLYLEFGDTRFNVPFKARPWLRPAMAATKKRIRDGAFWDKA